MPEPTPSRPPTTALPLQRRTWLAMAAAALLAACGSGGGGPAQTFNATFLQPWKSYETLPVEEWRRRLQLMRDLGCTEIILQWSALYGGSFPWVMPEDLIQLLFDEGGRHGMGVRVGLPYDEGWWNALRSSRAQGLPDFLARTQARCLETLQTSRWPAQPGFRGWYLPYELDQYNWATAERQALLVPWLRNLAEAARASYPHQPLALSTFYSTLPTSGRLAQLWAAILEEAAVRPMLQDGVGVAGLGNYAGLEPLRALLHERGVAFDLIVELFEQLPPLPNTNNAFRAKAASSERVAQQMAVARDFGAERIVAFAVDPWLLTSEDDAMTFPYTWGAQA